MAYGSVALMAARLVKPCSQTPGHSGGAVPESHRSSLFVDDTKRRAVHHQVRQG